MIHDPSLLVPVETLARPILAFACVPLQTGATLQTSPPALQVVGLLVGLPLLAGLVITLLVRWSSLARPVSGSPGTFADPVWLGPGGSEQDPEERQAALEAGPGARTAGVGAGTDQGDGTQQPEGGHAQDAVPSADVAGGPRRNAGTDDRGGASVRW